MARSRRSRKIGLGLAGGILLCVLAAFRCQQEARFAGEHGLLVFVRDDSLHVHWLTATPSPGRLEVVHAERAAVLAQVETPAAQAHRASVPLPRAREVELRYGAAQAGQRFTTRVSLQPPSRAPATVAAVDSLYVLGDTHGMYDELIGGLRNAGLIDSAGHWSGGRKHLVFAGDLVDRGPDVLQLLWFVYRLEREAAAAGGRVHVVLGNHEIMVMLGDLRYVHPKEARVAGLHGISYDRFLDVRTSVLGRWLASKPAAVRVGRVLIVHGGIGPEFATLSLQQLDRTLDSYMREDIFYRWADSTAKFDIDSAGLQQRTDFFFHPNSLFWHRAFVQSDTLGAALDRVLRRFDADMLVVGHTATPTVEARYDGRLITAHSRNYGGQLVLLVRSGRSYQRLRVGHVGAPVPF